MPSSQITVKRLQIIFREVFVMKFLYTVMHEWLTEQGWVDEKGLSNHIYMENLYMERRLKNKEWRIWWRVFKNPENSSYYRYRMNIEFNVITVTDMEIVREGKKVKVQRGELNVYITPIVEVDYTGKFMAHPILKYFDYYFRTRIMRKELGQHKKYVYREAYRFHGMIKKYLELKNFMPNVEVWSEKWDTL